jgi:DNA helicase-2/ATP-dependent DNA helicase PcrA
VSAGEGGLLGALTEPQRAAVSHDRGPMIVLAGPGAGKTRVITHRIAHLIQDRGTDPGRVLALTFTNKAADELRSRLIELIGPGAADRVQAHTFNSFGASLLRRFADVAGLPARPVHLDSAQRKRLMRRLRQERGVLRHAAAEGLDAAIERTNARINRMHCLGVRPGEAIAALRDAVAEADDTGERLSLESWLDAARAWEGLEDLCRDEGLIGYDEQIALASELLERDTRVAEMVRSDCAHIVVDEFQDVNAAQIRLLRAVAPPGSDADIAVVGDDDQSIYGFRGADDRALERFEKQWTVGDDRVRTVELSENWRSESCVIDASRAIIERAENRFHHDKSLQRADRLAGEPPAPGAAVEVVLLDDGQRDGAHIAAMILLDRERERERSGEARPWSSYAVLGRNGIDADRVRGALELEGIPVRSVRSTGAADDPAVQDVLAWARLLVDPSAGWCVRRVLRRPPLMIPEGRVVAWEKAWQAQRSRLEAGDGEAEDLPGLGTLLDWIGAVLPEGDPARATIDKLLNWYAELSALAAERRADEVVEAIVRTTGATGADLPDARARSTRITALVALLRFVRERRGRLDEPGDLRAFVSYYDDLDERDRTLDGQRTDPDAEPTPDGDDDAVSVMTAHGSKGLEFDTVFLARVGQHGYPSRRSDDPDLEPPACLRDEDAPANLRDDEERRLFYVAMTRAERRLVALGKLPKGKGTSVYYLLELLEAGAIERTGDEVLDAAREAGVVAGEAREPDLSQAIIDAVTLTASDERRRAREDAAAALDAADRAGGDPGRFEGIAARLVSAARRISGVAAAEAGEPTPAWVSGDADAATGAERVAAARSGAVRGASFEGMSAPLQLSYSMIDGFERCGLCFYVKQVLGLSEGFKPVMGVGNAVHRAMQAFTGACRDADAEGGERPGVEDLVEMGRQQVLQVWPRGEPIDAEDRERVEAQLRVAHEHLVDPRDDTVEVEREVRFAYTGPGGEHRFRAVIDRIDRIDGGVRLIDYKTGRASAGKLKPKADDLQLGVYAWAAAAYYADEDLAGTAEYWMLATGERGVIGLDKLRDGDAKLRKRVDRAIEGMLEGRFERGKKCRGACTSVFPEA